MVGGDVSLDGQNLVRRESAENMCDPQRLRVAVEDDISPCDSFKCLLCVCLASFPVNVGSKQETVVGELCHVDSSEKSYRVWGILLLDERGYVDEMWRARVV